MYVTDYLYLYYPVKNFKVRECHEQSNPHIKYICIFYTYKYNSIEISFDLFVERRIARSIRLVCRWQKHYLAARFLT